MRSLDSNEGLWDTRIVTILLRILASFLVGVPLGYSTGVLICLNSDDEFCGLNLIGLIPISTLFVYLILWRLSKTKIMSGFALNPKTSLVFIVIFGLVALFVFLFLLRQFGLLPI